MYSLTEDERNLRTPIYRGVWENIQIAYLQFVDNIIGVESSAYESINAYYLAVRKHKKTVDFLITFTGANRSIIRRAKYLISKFSEKNEISYI